MRGFRGSRSAQNAFNSRFGRDQQNQVQDKDSHNSNSETGHSNRPKLPEWLKTPETKAREKLEAEQRAQKTPVRAATVTPLPVAKSAPVVVQPVAIAKLKTEPAAKKTAPAARKKAPVAGRAGRTVKPRVSAAAKSTRKSPTKSPAKRKVA